MSSLICIGTSHGVVLVFGKKTFNISTDYNFHFLDNYFNKSVTENPFFSISSDNVFSFIRSSASTEACAWKHLNRYDLKASFIFLF